MRRILLALGVTAATACGVAPAPEAIGESTSSALISMPNVTWTSAGWPWTGYSIPSLAAGSGAAVGGEQATYAVVVSPRPGQAMLWYTTNNSSWAAFPSRPAGVLAQVAVGSAGGQLFVLTTAGVIEAWTGTVAAMQWTNVPYATGVSCLAAGANGDLWAVAGANLLHWTSASSIPAQVARASPSACSQLGVSSIGTVWMLAGAAISYFNTTTSNWWTPGGIGSPHAIAVDPFGNAYAQDSSGQMWSYAWAPTGSAWVPSGQYEPLFTAFAVGEEGTLFGAGVGESNILYSSDACPDEGMTAACAVALSANPYATFSSDNCGVPVVCSGSHHPKL